MPGIRTSRIRQSVACSTVEFRKVPGQRESLDPEAHGFKQSFERLPDGLVIVHN